MVALVVGSQEIWCLCGGGDLFEVLQWWRILTDLVFL